MTMFSFLDNIFKKQNSPNQKVTSVGSGTNIESTTKFVMLIILDGFGVSHDSYGNAVINAMTPNLDVMWSKGRSTLLTSSGTVVGLPASDPGNSEVGHLLIGGGRVIFQSLELINDQLVSGNFRNNVEFKKLIEHVKQSGKKLHLMGMLSAGGVHGHISHLFSMMEICKLEGVEPYIHAFLDGRDTGPTDGLFYLSKLSQTIKDLGVGTIASISGRYFSMDRDYRWDRTFRSYNAIVGKGERTSKDIFNVIQGAYKNGETDESFIPTTMLGADGLAVGPMQEGDGVLMWNYREDRARQIVKAMVVEDLPGPKREIFIPNLYVATMRGYADNAPIHVLFSPNMMSDSLSELVSKAGYKQLHVAESEKYAHVTYFFNGGMEKPFQNEEVQIVPSPKIADYSETPEMSSQLINDQILYALDNLDKNDYKFFVINYACPDMLAHTGNYARTLEAVSAVDKFVGEITKKVVALGGCVVITADHGNCETMIDKINGGVDTKHNANPVPFVLVSKPEQTVASSTDVLFKIGEGPDGQESGILADVAPTILYLLGIEKPDSMTGISLVRSTG
jgi:2,3-bisphosphoglycerate-independent phosphoglycerate mutase